MGAVSAVEAVLGGETVEPTLHPEMRRFVDDVTEIVRRGGGEEVVTTRVASRLDELLRSPEVLDPRCTKPHADNYVLYPVWVAPDGAFSVAAAVWNVGQVTPIHDHGTWGVIGIYGGVEHEVRYERTRASGVGALTQLSERDIRAGQVIVCCTSDHDIHRVSCGSHVPCVGIHVYGADIGKMPRHVYDPATGNMRTFVSAWTPLDAAPENAG